MSCKSRVRLFDSRLVMGVGAVLLLLTAFGAKAAGAQWSANPGETVRNAFGPPKRGEARTCQGACGVQCPSSCAESVAYECVDGGNLRQVRTYACGTHQGCRDHDDCLDRCAIERARGFDCQAKCHSEAIEGFGFEWATSWAGGGGPFDGPPITFEYTRRGPDELEPGFRCPDGASLTCSAGRGVCRTASGPVEPVFDAFLGGRGIRISSFRSGELCGGEVCAQAVDIQVTGEESCPGAGDCTRYGVEFDYENADPSAPLECETSTESSDGDFIGDLLKKGFDSAADLDGDTFEGNEGLGQLLGMFQKVVQSADTPDEVGISITPLGPDGKPVEEKRVDIGNPDAPPRVPPTVELPGSRGHLVVPMYEVADQPGVTKVKEVRLFAQW